MLRPRGRDEEKQTSPNSKSKLPGAVISGFPGGVPSDSETPFQNILTPVRIWSTSVRPDASREYADVRWAHTAGGAGGQADHSPAGTLARRAVQNNSLDCETSSISPA